jgi:hypothetical protein
MFTVILAVLVALDPSRKQKQRQNFLGMSVLKRRGPSDGHGKLTQGQG